MGTSINHQDSIRCFSKGLQMYPKIKNGAPCVTLYVEGDIDCGIYNAIKNATLATNTHYNFMPIIPFKQYDKYYAASYGVKLSDQSYKAFDFVIDAVYANNKKTCYGIIDNDFDQHALYETNRNLAITESHDHETMLLLCYFDRFFKYLTKKMSLAQQDGLLSDIKSISAFTVKQGILENSSITLTRKRQLLDEDVKLLTKITHTYFKYRCSDYEIVHNKRQPKDVAAFYSSNFDNEIQLSITLNGGDNSITKQLITAYKRNLQKKEALLNEILNGDIIQKWLYEGYFNLEKSDQWKIHKLCWYANGHFFISQLKLCLEYYDNNYVTINNEDFSGLMLHYLSSYAEQFCSMNPLNKYIKDVT